MKVRVLAEQTPHHSQPDRGYLPSGEVVDIEKGWAAELLNSGAAEPVAEKPAGRAEKRPAAKAAEKR